MEYKAVYATDKGIVKEINQDSLCIKHGKTPGGEVLMAVICDGMGGLSSGELASSSVVMDFNDWFSELLGETVDSMTVDDIEMQWNRLISDVNGRIYNYGKGNGVQLGTTLTAMMILPKGEYVIAHVGDTRVYEYRASNLAQLTEDQTFVAREIKMGRMTPEEALVDKRRNVLLQCVGGEKSVCPQFYFGKVHKNDQYLLCSDGFRHKLSETEIATHMAKLDYWAHPKETLQEMIEVNKQRQERDNISVLCIKIE